MITTRFGSEIQIKAVDRNGEWVRVKRLSDGADREWRIADLRADTMAELEDELVSAPVYDGASR